MTLGSDLGLGMSTMALTYFPFVWIPSLVKICPMNLTLLCLNCIFDLLNLIFYFNAFSKTHLIFYNIVFGFRRSRYNNVIKIYAYPFKIIKYLVIFLLKNLGCRCKKQNIQIDRDRTMFQKFINLRSNLLQFAQPSFMSRTVKYNWLLSFPIFSPEGVKKCSRYTALFSSLGSRHNRKSPLGFSMTGCTHPVDLSIFWTTPSFS